MPDPVQPARFLVSPGLTPDTVTRTRTSPGPGCGSGSSPTCSTSAAGPCSSYQDASMGDSVALRLVSASSLGGRRVGVCVVGSGVVLAQGFAQPGAFGAADGAGGEHHAAPVGVGNVFGAKGPLLVVEETCRLLQEVEASAQHGMLVGHVGQLGEER